MKVVKSLYLLVFYLCIATNTYTKNKLFLSNTPTLQTKPLHAIQERTLALFDTSETDKYCYKPILEIARTNNFNITYYPISKIIDADLDDIPYESYDCAFFIMSPEFLKTMQKSPISQKVLSIMKTYSHIPHTMTSIMLPSIRVNKKPLTAFSYLFKQVGVEVAPDQISSQEDLMFTKVTNQFLQTPLEYKSLAYHTTLKSPHKQEPFNIAQTINQGITPLALLPIKQDDYIKEIKSIFPFGVYWFNKKRNNHLMVSNSNILSLSGITENFQICPMEFFVRKDLHQALNQMMWETHHIVSQDQSHKGADVTTICSSKRERLPFFLQTLGDYSPQKKYAKTKKVAWMELNAFDPKHKMKRKSKQQQLLIKFILNANIDALWISFNPNMYYSPIAKNKQSYKNFLKTISLFTKKLTRSADRKNKKIPAILVGVEITNNLYKPNLPTTCAKDLYGNTYEDIPRPLDTTFWKNEIIQPIKAFIEQWKHHKISHGIPITGVVLDLEMYCRKTSSIFLSTMGFEYETISDFLKPPLSKTVPQDLFAQYILDNKRSTEYFSFLESKASALGNSLYQTFKKTIPNCVIGCYAPNISLNWFYKGLYNGLSTKENPVHLFTFNSEFNSHKKWLEKNNIQINHYGVLMLSKLKSKKDFLWCKHVKQHHDGIWFNRFSRLAEPFHDDWSTLEQTPMPIKKRKELIEYLNKML